GGSDSWSWLHATGVACRGERGSPDTLVRVFPTAAGRRGAAARRRGGGPPAPQHPRHFRTSAPPIDAADAENCSGCRERAGSPPDGPGRDPRPGGRIRGIFAHPRQESTPRMRRTAADAVRGHTDPRAGQLDMKPTSRPPVTLTARL